MSAWKARLVSVALAFASVGSAGAAHAQARAPAARPDRQAAEAQRLANDVFRFIGQRNAQIEDAARGFHGRRLAGVPKANADLFDFIRQADDADRRDLPEVTSIRAVLNRGAALRPFANEAALKSLGELDASLPKLRTSVALRTLPGGFARRFEDYKAEIAQIEARAAANPDPQQRRGIEDFLVARREGFERSNVRDIRRIRAVLDGSRNWFAGQAQAQARLCALGLIAEARAGGREPEPELAEILAWSGDRMEIAIDARANAAPRFDLTVAVLGNERAQALSALFAAKSCLPGGGRVAAR